MLSNLSKYGAVDIVTRWTLYARYAITSLGLTVTKKIMELLMSIVKKVFFVSRLTISNIRVNLGGAQKSF